MIYRFIQEKSKGSVKYNCVDDEGNTIYSADVPYNCKNAKANVYKKGNMICSVGFSRGKSNKDLSKDKLLLGVLPYNIYDLDDNLIGKFSIRKSKVFNGEEYCEMDLDGTVYKIYKVDLGKEGIKIVIFIGNYQIALIEKSLKSKGNKNTYNIVSVDEDSMGIACLFNLYYDFIRLTKSNGFTYKYNKISHIISNIRLRYKYDRYFKDVYSVKRGVVWCD